MPDNEYPADIVDLPYADDPELARIKMLPHSIEAEQSVLGGLLLSNDAWDAIAEAVSASDFYRPDHRLIFQQMATLADGDANSSKTRDPSGASTGVTPSGRMFETVVSCSATRERAQ